MPVILDTVGRGSEEDSLRGDCLTIGLVNNMPDAAFKSTEQQFINLIGMAASKAVVRLKLFSIPQIPRADDMRGEIAGRYRPVAELWDCAIDALIVTGTEPRAVRLTDEPYWPPLTGLVDWARDNTFSTIWSCLAAHAAVLHADGIERSPFAEKLFGVFACETLAAHPLTCESTGLWVPHSRFNDLPEAALIASGYSVLSRSTAVGADAFIKERDGSSLFVFFQGHPEYDADSLLREYRRDVGRFLRGEQAHYPAAPHGYLDAGAITLLNAFHASAADRRRGSLIADFPMAELEAGLGNTWRESAVDLYRNWIGILKDRKKAQGSGLVYPKGALRRSVCSAGARRHLAVTAETR